MNDPTKYFDGTLRHLWLDYCAKKEEIEALKEINTELVEALQYCRQKISYMTTHGEWYSPGIAIEKADAALAKAEAK